jgi:hypothetical protein
MKDYVAPFREELSAAPFSEDTRTSGLKRSGVAFFLVIGARSDVATFGSAIDAAIAGGAFLEWNEQRHRYSLGPIHLALIKPRFEMRLLQRNEAAFQPAWNARLYGWLERGKDRSAPPWDDVAPSMLLMTAAALHDRHSNILDLCAALIPATDGDCAALDNLQLWHPSAPKAARYPFPHDGERPRKANAFCSALAVTIKGAERRARPASDDDD